MKTSLSLFHSYPPFDFLEEHDVVMPVNQFFLAQQPEAIVAELNPQLSSLKEKALTKPSYVVQLGALKNAAKVNEIFAKLRLSGYNAYTFYRRSLYRGR